MHTPGEWVAIPPKKKGKHWRVGARAPLGGNGAIANVSATWDLATVWNGAPGDTLETEAENARLFAASRDLLAACQAKLAALKGKEYNPDAFDHAAELCRAAIAKATGA